MTYLTSDCISQTPWK